MSAPCAWCGHSRSEHTERSRHDGRPGVCPGTSTSFYTVSPALRCEELAATGSGVFASVDDACDALGFPPAQPGDPDITIGACVQGLSVAAGRLERVEHDLRVVGRHVEADAARAALAQVLALRAGLRPLQVRR